MMKSEVIIYTDGASRGNPGPAGWGAVILATPYAMEIAGSTNNATNNQMELTAVLEVLSDSGAKSSEKLIVYSDSAYVVNGLNSWVYGWEKKDWVTTQKTPVENKDIWIKLLELLRFYGNKLTIKKVSGHSGELYNERCDELAVNAALNKPQELFKGTINDYQSFLKEVGTTIKETKKKKPKNNSKAYSYVSLVSGKVYVDKDWKICEKRVKGQANVKFKKVFSKEEESELIKSFRNS